MVDHDLSGRILGDYVLGELIGKGGYGAVYSGVQPLLEREVVIKVLHAERTDSDSRERFLREARLAAQLNHLYAAHVYDFGAEDQGDVLWIAMERVPGIPLDAWLKTHGPMPPELLGPFFEAVCEVVHAVHELGIVHRDLKPSNIMVIESRERLVPKLLDFGIARWNRPSEVAPAPATDEDGDPDRDNVKTQRLPFRPRRAGRAVACDDSELRRQLTPPGGGLGSPPYMAPEQRRGADCVGPEADIYALGVVAYEMLTTRKPFATDRTVGGSEQHECGPAPQLGDGFSPSLDRVIQCALDRNPRARHRTALELAADLRRALRASVREQLRSSAEQWRDQCAPPGLLWGPDVLEDALRAVPPETLGPLECSFVAESQRRIRRGRWIHRLLVALAAVVAVGGLLYRAAMQARMAREVSEATVTQAELEQGRAALLHDDLVEAQQHLGEAWRRGERSGATAFMYARALQPLRAEIARLPALSGRMWSAAFSPDGKQIVTTDDKGAQIWNAENYQQLYPLPHEDAVYSAVYRADGARLVTAGADGTVRIWDAATGSLVRELRLHGRKPRWYVAAVNGDRVAAVDLPGAIAAVWDARTGAVLAEVELPAAKWPSIAFSPEGRHLAVSGGGEVRVLDTASWAATTFGEGVRALAWDPAGEHLLTGSGTGDASIWCVPRGERTPLRLAGETITAVAFSLDGEHVAIGGEDGTEQVFNAGTGRMLSQRNYLHAKVFSIDFDATGQRIATASASGGLAIADAMDGTPLAILEGPKQQLRVARFDPAGLRILAASWDGSTRVWDASSSYRRWSVGALTDAFGLFGGVEPDGRFLAIACPKCATRVWDTAHDRLLAALPPVGQRGEDDPVPFPAVSPTGDAAAIARGSDAEVYSLPDGVLRRKIRHGAAVTAMAFESGGELVSGDVLGSVVVTRGSESIALARPNGSEIAALVVLPGDRIAAGDAHGHVRLFGGEAENADIATGVSARMLRPSPDGHRLLVVPHHAGKAAPMVLLDLDRGTMIRLEGPPVWSARWIDGGRAILSAHADGAARLWSSDGRPLQTYRGGPRFLAEADLAPDGSFVVGGGGDGMLRFWDAATGRQLWALQAHKIYVMGMHFDQSGDLVTRGTGGEVSRWHLPDPLRVIGTRKIEATAMGP